MEYMNWLKNKYGNTNLNPDKLVFPYLFFNQFIYSIIILPPQF